jgi:hypothetical protein
MKRKQSERFNNSYQNIREWVYKNELQRREWANEIWAHPNGRLFKLAKILTPVFSVYAVISLIIYCLIRDAQKMMVDMLSYEVNTEFTEILILLSVVCVLAIITGNVLLFMKKRRIGGWTVGIAAIISLAQMLTQFSVPMGDDKFKIFCFINMGAYLLLAVFALFIPGMLMHEKRSIEAMTQNTLKRITADCKSLLTDDEYADLIDEYLENEKEKMSEHREKMKRKRAKKER